MGVDAHGLNLLCYAREAGDFGRVVTIGRQHIHASADYLRARLGVTKSATPGAFCDDMLRESFGAREVQSLDVSDYEGASILQDMNKPLAVGGGGFDTVIDFGSIEHVFDIATALANIRKLCAPGGQILHVLPADGYCGHGFWQVSPELFFACYQGSNGFAETEVFLAPTAAGRYWYRVVPRRDGGRVLTQSRRELYVICRTRKVRDVADVAVAQTDYQVHWGAAESVASDWRARMPGWLPNRAKEWVERRYTGVTRFHPHLQRVAAAAARPPSAGR